MFSDVSARSSRGDLENEARATDLVAWLGVIQPWREVYLRRALSRVVQNGWHLSGSLLLPRIHPEAMGSQCVAAKVLWKEHVYNFAFMYYSSQHFAFWFLAML